MSRHVCIATAQHDHAVPNRDWRRAFEEAIDEYGRLVDISVPGIQNPCRADLYLFASDGIVSLELKYIGPGQSLNVPKAVAQMRRYRHHKRSLLVGYAAQLSHAGLEENVRKVEGELKRRGQEAKALVVRGPEIVRVEATEITGQGGYLK